MIRRLLALAGVLVVAMSAVAVASTTPTKHKLDIHAKAHKTGTASDGALVYKGSFAGKPGKGTVVIQDKVTSATTSTATSTAKFKKGTVKAVFKLTNQITTSGIAYTGTGHVVSGSGALKHVRGKHLKITGTSDATASQTTFHVTGTLTY